MKLGIQDANFSPKDSFLKENQGELLEKNFKYSDNLDGILNEKVNNPNNLPVKTKTRMVKLGTGDLIEIQQQVLSPKFTNFEDILKEGSSVNYYCKNNDNGIEGKPNQNSKGVSLNERHTKKPKPGVKISSDHVLNKKQQKKSNEIDYSNVMEQLYLQKNQKDIEVITGGKSYKIKNLHCKSVEELANKLAEKMYQDIRKDKLDVQQIANANTLDPNKIKICKDHVFIKVHKLDFDESLGQPAVYAQFKPNLKHALAWERFKLGQASEADIEWLRHETVEARYEAQHNAGYTESHEYAQTNYDGDPWNDRWDKKNI